MALVAAAASVVAAAAWAKDLALTAEPAEGQTLAYDEGRAVLVSEGKAAIVAVMIEKARFRDQDGPLFQLAVDNQSGEAVSVAQADITASADAGKTRVMSVADLEREARRAGDRIRRAAAVDDPYSTGSYGGMGPTGRPAGGSAGAYVGASGGASSELGRTARALGDGADVEAEMRAQARLIGFKPLTAPPGQRVYTGLPLAPLSRKATQVDLAVTVAGERHAFRFKVAPAPR